MKKLLLSALVISGAVASMAVADIGHMGQRFPLVKRLAKIDAKLDWLHRAIRNPSLIDRKIAMLEAARKNPALLERKIVMLEKRKNLLRARIAGRVRRRLVEAGPMIRGRMHEFAEEHPAAAAAIRGRIRKRAGDFAERHPLAAKRARTVLAERSGALEEEAE